MARDRRRLGPTQLSHEVLITDELSHRPARPPDYEAESRALVELARAMVDSPQSILQMLVGMALDLCNAQTAGISLLESSDTGEEIFRWRALAGSTRPIWERRPPAASAPAAPSSIASPPNRSSTRAALHVPRGGVPLRDPNAC